MMISVALSATAGNADELVEVHPTHFGKMNDPTFYEPAVCLSVDNRVDKHWASRKSTHLKPAEARALARELVLAADRAEVAEAERRSPQ